MEHAAQIQIVLIWRQLSSIYVLNLLSDVPLVPTKQW